MKLNNYMYIYIYMYILYMYMYIIDSYCVIHQRLAGAAW